MPGKLFDNIFIPADTSGTGCWRGIWPIDIMNSLAQSTNTRVSTMCRPSVEFDFYKGVSSVMYQRQVSPAEHALVCSALASYSKALGFWTIYNIDDCMGDDEIPLYNRGRMAFHNPETQKNIREMLNSSDFVLVTTDEIKQYYHDKFGVPSDNIICIPNYLPRWWIGDYYDREKSVSNFRKNKAKPRIGIISSLSHYNTEHIKTDLNSKLIIKQLKNGNYLNEDGKEVKKEDVSEVKDDLDLIIETIKSTVDDFQWVFFGYAPPLLDGLIKSKKIEVYPGVSIYNYPSKLEKLNLNCVVAPLIDMTFNRCKSNIKYLECCAMGIPLLAQDICTYNKYMPKDWLFQDAESLKQKLFHLKDMSASVFGDTIESNFKFLNSPNKECGVPARNWWMEDNIGNWLKIFSPRQKCMEVSFSAYLASRAKKEEEDKKKTLYSDLSTGVLIRR